MVMYMNKKMSQILMDANQELQITGSYLFDWDQKKQKAKGYCAVGMLACQTKNVNEFGDIENEYFWVKSAFGLSHDDVRTFDRVCPACIDDWSCIEGCGYNKDTPKTETVISLIVHMNDEHEMTFKEIGEYLKKMGF